MGYPKYFVYSALKSAKMKFYNSERKPFDINNLIILSFKPSLFLMSCLPENINTVVTNKNNLKQILFTPRNKTEIDAGAYTIHCKNCPSKYFGERIPFHVELHDINTVSEQEIKILL